MRIAALAVVYATFVIALMLELMPLPAAVVDWRPNWVMLVLTYWVLALPHRFSIGHGWVLGLLLDVLLGAPLGLNALVLSIISYLVAANYQRIRTMALVQQAFVVAALSVLCQLLHVAGEYLINGERFRPDVLQPTLPSALLWPLLFLIMRRLRRRFLVR